MTARSKNIIWWLVIFLTLVLALDGALVDVELGVCGHHHEHEHEHECGDSCICACRIHMAALTEQKDPTLLNNDSTETITTLDHPFIQSYLTSGIFHPPKLG